MHIITTACTYSEEGIRPATDKEWTTVALHHGMIHGVLFLSCAYFVAADHVIVDVHAPTNTA